MEALRVTHEIARVNFEESREELPRFVRQVLARTLLDQREVRLADGFLELSLDGAYQLGLRELTSEPAKVPFELPQLPELLGESHCNQQY